MSRDSPRARARPGPAACARKRVRSLAGLALLTTACGCSEGDGAARVASGDELAPAVEVVRARHGVVPLEERVGGVVRAENQISIRPEITAPIREVFVRNGDAVRAGQPLVRLADDALRDQVRQAEANIRVAEAQVEEARTRAEQAAVQMERARDLAAREVLSPAEIEVQTADLAAARAGAAEAAARVEQARAMLEERRTMLARTVIRAPVSGRVGRRDAEVGAIADAATPLFVIGDLSRLVIEVPISERALGFVRVGQPVRILSPAFPELSIPATLDRISPFLAASSFSTQAEIDLESSDDRLRPGMFVDVEILYGTTHESTLVPVGALWTDPRTGLQGVFVADWSPPSGESAADSALSAQAYPTTFRPLEVVAHGQGVAGVDDLEPGSWVVTVGQHLLAGSGAPARLRQTSWERVLDLQARQREDLLRAFLEKQRRAARTQGARPTTSAEYLSAPAGEKPPGRTAPH